MRGYFRYWGKAAGSSAETGSEPCHLLPYHSLDVAAVGWRLTHPGRRQARHIGSQLRLDGETLRALFTYSLALHDLGKFARCFQSLAQPTGVDLVPPPSRPMPYRHRHDALGRQAWKCALLPRLREHSGCGMPDTGSISFTAAKSIDIWFGCAFGHHGKPPPMPQMELDASFLPEDIEAAWEFAADIASLLPPAWPLTQLGDTHWRDHVLKPSTWALAGLAVVCDWLGSNTQFFTYVTEPMPLARYWDKHALPAAERALHSAGLLQVCVPAAFRGFRKTFGFAPTPLQAWAEAIDLAGGPQLFVLEDITGAGKTEAALTLAQRLLAAGLGDGLYFGLPTMATSNAMYHRLGQHYENFYEGKPRASLVLAHGARDFNEAFTKSIIPEPQAEGPYTKGDDAGTTECRAWLADNRKKALLAEVGVGTIDQALLGILPRRHQSLRLLGLRGKVLIVDEVHAYDSYTATLLQCQLEAHARDGGSAILLSATIPQTLRQKLIEAWRRGRAIELASATQATAFPLATHVHDGGLAEQALAPRPASCRRTPVQFVHQFDQALEGVLEAARAGRCVAWIRNTVDDAVAAYRQVRASLREPDKAHLFHARFAMADRQRIESEALQRFGKASTASERAGHVLVATQVVEQSLDLDFDELVTDLAPIDLLIQRSGRLHRHPRHAEGNPMDSPDAADGRPAPCLTVLTPPWSDDPDEDWLRRLLPGTAAVYRDPAQLWRTAGVLREQGGILLPEGARHLLESVYGPDAPLPAGLEEASLRSEGDRQAAAGGARFNVLDLSQGYVSKNEDWHDSQEIGTRLSDGPAVAVILARLGDGTLEPWHSGHNRPWAMSTVTLRENLARRLPPLPPAAEAAVEALQQRYPALRWAQFWLPELAVETTLLYDRELGVVSPHQSGER